MLFGIDQTGAREPRSRLRGIASAALLAAAVLAAPAQADDGSGLEGEIVAAVLADFAPLFMRGAIGELTGFGVDAMGEIAALAGLRVRYLVEESWLAADAVLRRRIRGRAGLDDVRIHDLRHSFASRALALGEGLPMIGKLLGHTQVQTTARYAHLARDTVKASAARIGDSIDQDLAGVGEPGVEVAPRGADAAMVGLELDGDAGMGGPEGSQSRQQPLLGDRLDRDDAHPPGCMALEFGDAVHLGQNALHLLEIGLATAIELHAAGAAVEELSVEMLLQGADAVGDGGGGDAEFLPRLGEALVAGGGLEEAQAFERGEVEHGEGPEGVLWKNVIMSSHIRALETSWGAEAAPAGRRL